MTKRYKLAKYVTLLGACVNGGLGLLKITGGMMFASHALIADGLHSLSDLITDTMVLFAAKYGSQAADKSHPYGHQRIETAATLLLSLLLILTGVAIAWDALDEWLHHHLNHPHSYALVVAMISVIANEGVFRLTQRIGRDIRSDLILANAWHHRSDALASGVVTLGIAGSLLGLTALDFIAAMVIGGLIVQMGISYGWKSVKELIDTAVDPEVVKHIHHTIQNVTGVVKLHRLRSRLMAGDIFIDVHVLVSPNLSVTEGHFIAEQVREALLDQFEHVRDVLIHIDTEEDEQSSSAHLPTRAYLETHFLKPWQTEHPVLKRWVLHYLHQELSIDLFCDAKPTKDFDKTLRAARPSIPHLRAIRVFVEQPDLPIRR